MNRNYIIKSSKAGKKRKCYTITLNKSNMISEVNKEQTVSAEKNKLYSTDIGRIVNKFLNKNFSDVINYDFTCDLSY